MPSYKLRALIEFDDAKFLPKVLMNRPGYRLVLLNLRRGQSVPEHSTREMVTVYAIAGHVTFYENQSPSDLCAGEVLFIEGGVPHKLEAHDDSSLLVVAAGSNTLPSESPVLDLRETPRSQRHPLVFSRLDALRAGESFELINDHDPIPLHQQIDKLRPGQAEWSYVERKPEFFRIRARRIAAPGWTESAASVQTETLLAVQQR